MRHQRSGEPADRRRRFEAIYVVNCGPILGYALRRTANGDDAADVVAETFLTAWRRLDDVPPGDEARLWLSPARGESTAPTPGRLARSCSGSAPPAPPSARAPRTRAPRSHPPPRPHPRAEATGATGFARVVGTLLPWRQLGADVMTGAGPGQQ